jgi:hypothetical protein
MPSKNLRTLNNGWPLGDGPLSMPVRFDIRDRRVFLMCQEGCPQAIWAATDPVDHVGYTVDLALLKARVADHWLKVHPAEIADLTYC